MTEKTKKDVILKVKEKRIRKLTFSKKEKFIILIVKQIGNNYRLLKKFKFKPSTKEIVYQKHTIPIDKLPKPIQKRNKYYWIIDLDLGILCINEPNQQYIDFQLLNSFVNKKIFYNFSSLMSGKGTKKFTDMLIGGIIGLLLGIVVMMVI